MGRSIWSFCRSTKTVAPSFFRKGSLWELTCQPPGEVRGTNAQKYGYGGNTLNWQARAFGGIAFPIPIKKVLVISPTFEIDQEPEKIKYVPTATLPTDLIYAVRISHAPDSRWSFDIGTGHVGATLGPGINIKVNNAIAFAADFRILRRSNSE